MLKKIIRDLFPLAFLIVLSNIFYLVRRVEANVINSLDIKVCSTMLIISIGIILINLIVWLKKGKR